MTYYVSNSHKINYVVIIIIYDYLPHLTTNNPSPATRNHNTVLRELNCGNRSYLFSISKAKRLCKHTKIVNRGSGQTSPHPGIVPHEAYNTWVPPPKPIYEREREKAIQGKVIKRDD